MRTRPRASSNPLQPAAPRPAAPTTTCPRPPPAGRPGRRPSARTCAPVQPARPRQRPACPHLRSRPGRRPQPPRRQACCPARASLTGSRRARAPGPAHGQCPPRPASRGPGALPAAPALAAPRRRRGAPWRPHGRAQARGARGGARGPRSARASHVPALLSGPCAAPRPPGQGVHLCSQDPVRGSPPLGHIPQARSWRTLHRAAPAQVLAWLAGQPCLSSLDPGHCAEAGPCLAS